MLEPFPSRTDGAPVRAALCLLARAPVAGQAKTRLIPHLGPEGAARAHARLVTHVVGVARAWRDAAEGRLLRLWCAPDASHPFFHDLAAPEERRAQPDGDLGARLAFIARQGLAWSALESASAPRLPLKKRNVLSRSGPAGHGPAETRAVLLLGGDCVSVDAALLEQAEAALRTRPAVLAPAEDGGYALLGLRRFAPALFEDIPWGTAEVAAMTRARLRGLGWAWRELPRQWDVDRPEDWERFLRMFDFDAVDG